MGGGERVGNKTGKEVEWTRLSSPPVPLLTGNETDTMTPPSRERQRSHSRSMAILCSSPCSASRVPLSTTTAAPPSGTLGMRRASDTQGGSSNVQLIVHHTSLSVAPSPALSFKPFILSQHHTVV